MCSGGTVQVCNRAPTSDRPAPSTVAAGHASFSASVFVDFKVSSHEMCISGEQVSIISMFTEKLALLCCLLFFFFP